MLDAGVNAMVHSGLVGYFSLRFFPFLTGASGMFKRLLPMGRGGTRTTEYAKQTTNN